MSTEEIERRIKSAENKADHAAEIAMAAIEAQRSLHSALESAHQQMGEMLAASKHISKLAESLARFVLSVEKKD